MNSEVLRYRVCDRKYNKETNTLEVVKVYHLYWDAPTKTINIKEPIRVSLLRRIKKLLKFNNINYNNIIIGRPDI